MIRVNGFCTRPWVAGCVAGVEVGWVAGDEDEDEGVEGSVTGASLRERWKSRDEHRGPAEGAHPL
jgi:hypothetical protein